MKKQPLFNALLGVLGILSSSIAALSDPKLTPVCGVFSAVAFGVLGFVQPTKNYSKFVSAWRVLDSAVCKYRFGKLPIEGLLEAKDRGEDIIGGYEREHSKDKTN
jgi:hypothetical protein